MDNIRTNLRKLKILRTFASLNITVSCLLLLFILTLWGTIAQVQNGLYLAQERFFHSFFFLAGGFFPFPGAQLVMWVLFFNLISVMLIRFVYSWKKIGILIIHFGILSFLVSGYIILHCAQESHLSLKEGQAANFSVAFHDWELAFWEDSPQKQQRISEQTVTAVDIGQLKKERSVVLEEGFVLHLKEYFPNADAYVSGGDTNKYVNASGIQKLTSLKREKEPEKNLPGAIFDIESKDAGKAELLLYGGESKPTTLNVGERQINVSLRRQRYILPFTLKLIDFIKEEHPGTNTPKSFKSRVEIETNGAWREKLIYMNNPLRYKDYTFYQSAFSVDEQLNETSTLAVVKNSGQIMPYISTFVTFAGLIVHFVMMALSSRGPRKEESDYV
ncbi:MAG TPA: cytochrome c biogenesis protein ResB [Candidatus Omnitrophota bacterium]|nr:cytochrome c biogenesis protein ResB [Candidatus Omnitrophota bacterium]